MRKSGAALFHPFLLRSSYNGMLIEEAAVVLWGRFVFSIEFEADVAPAELKVAVQSHASWGAPGSVRASEQLEGTLDLAQGLVVLSRVSCEDPSGLLAPVTADPNPGYHLWLQGDGRSIMGLSSGKRVVQMTSTVLNSSCSETMAHCSLTNRTHHVDVVLNGGQVSLEGSLTSAPWRATLCEPDGPHHIPGAVPLTLQHAESSDGLMLADAGERVRTVPSVEGGKEQLWELSPVGMLVNQHSGHYLCCDGHSLSMVQFDDSMPDQNLDGKQWDICVAVTALQSLMKAVSMRYVGFLVKYIQDIEVILCCVIYLEAYPCDPSEKTAKIMGKIDWSVQRVTEIKSGKDSSTVAAGFKLHREQQHTASHTFDGHFLYGQAIAELSMTACEDENSMLSSISTCCAEARVCRLALSNDASECGVLIAAEGGFCGHMASKVTELVRAHAMHDRSVKLPPYKADGTAGASELSNVDPVDNGGDQGLGKLGSQGHITWKHHAHPSCTQALLRIASSAGNQKVELRVGGPEGVLLGECQIRSTGAADAFDTQMFECVVPPSNQEGLLTLIFANPGGECILDSLVLHTKATAEELQLLELIEQHKSETINALQAANVHMTQVEEAGCTAEVPEAAQARRSAGESKKQAKIAQKAYVQVEQLSQQLPPLLLMRTASFAENALALQLLQLEFGLLSELAKRARATVERRQLEFAQRVREEEAARQLYLEAIRGRREAGEQMATLKQQADDQGTVTAHAQQKLEGDGHPLLVLVEDYHETAERHRLDADAARNEAAGVAHDAAQLAIKKGRLETEDKARKAAARAAEQIARDTEQMLQEAHLSDDDENDYDNSKPTMMLFQGGKPVHTVVNVENSDTVGDEFNAYIKAAQSRGQ